MNATTANRKYIAPDAAMKKAEDAWYGDPEEEIEEPWFTELNRQAERKNEDDGYWD